MDPAYLPAHVEEDREHWWFRGRLEILRSVVAARTRDQRGLRLVELGCGTGNVLAALRDLGETIGVEVDDTLRAAAVAHGLDVRFGALPDRVPVDPGSAGVVLLLDVLEHLDDAAAALDAARKLLRPGGLLVVTVPAYRWLWSAHDVMLGHRRRYTRGALVRELAEAGFAIECATYFNTLLFPAVAAVRLAGRMRGHDGHDLHRPPAMINRALARVFATERHLVGRVALPFGSSILVVARG